MDSHEKRILKEKEEHIEEELRQIYEDEQGEMPDLSSLDAPIKSWRKTGWMVAGVLFILTILIWVGFFFSGGITFTGQDDYLNIEITAQPISEETEKSEPLVSGTPSRILIHYENKTRTPIASLSFRVNLPDAFIIDRFVPEATEGENEWQLGSLAGKSDGLIELFGTLVGTVPSVDKIQVVASYRPANFSSEFDAIILEDLVLEESATRIEFETTDKASPGENIEFTYELLNPSRYALNHVRLKVVAPDGFNVSESDPPIGEGFIWSVPRLEAHSKASFTLTGTFSANTKGLHDVGGEVYLENNNKSYLQTQATRTIDVFGGALSTNVIINGSARDQNVDPGSLLRISLPFENDSEIDVNDIEITLDVEASESAPINWTSASTSLGGGDRSGTSISWDSEILETLESLSPGESGTIDLTLALNDIVDEGDSDSMSFIVTISATPTTNTSNRQTLSTTPIRVSLNSNASIYTSAVYHDSEGNALGSGPLPPTIGSSTEYAIIWSIQNSLHDLENVVFEAELPDHVMFSGNEQTSAGSISYNSERDKVRWEVSSLDSGASARFNVSVTPDSGDLGSFLRLTNPVTVTARDSVTESNIRLEGDTLTTQLHDDAFATDDGVVIE